MQYATPQTGSALPIANENAALQKLREKLLGKKAKPAAKNSLQSNMKPSSKKSAVGLSVSTQPDSDDDPESRVSSIAPKNPAKKRKRAQPEKNAHIEDHTPTPVESSNPSHVTTTPGDPDPKSNMSNPQENQPNGDTEDKKGKAKKRKRKKQKKSHEDR